MLNILGTKNILLFFFFEIKSQKIRASKKHVLKENNYRLSILRKHKMNDNVDINYFFNHLFILNNDVMYNYKF